MTLAGVKLPDGNVYLDVICEYDPDPVRRARDIIEKIAKAFPEYEPSGLDEFHPDTTHNP